MTRGLIGAFLAGAVAASGGLALANGEGAGHPFIVDMERDMTRMMANMHATGYSGDWDADFLAMMIPHHQGAIDMARLVLVHGRDPLTRDLAVGIIASQQVEIEAMTARLAALRNTQDPPPADAFPPLSGTRGSGR